MGDAKTTRYVVLSQAEAGTWEEHTTVAAASAKAAIKLVVGSLRLDGRYVAVPARSWQPEQVKVQVEPVVRFGAA